MTFTARSTAACRASSDTSKRTVGSRAAEEMGARSLVDGTNDTCDNGTPQACRSAAVETTHFGGALQANIIAAVFWSRIFMCLS